MIWGYLDAGVSTVARGDECVCVCVRQKPNCRALFTFSYCTVIKRTPVTLPLVKSGAGGAMSVPVLLDLPHHAFMPPPQSAQLGLPRTSRAVVLLNPRLAAGGAQNLTPLLSFKIN